MDDDNSFGDYLKQLMKNRRIKPSQLAARLNVDPSLVRKWLAGARVPPLKANYLDLISSYLGLDADQQILLKINQLYSIDEKIITLTDQLQIAKDHADECRQALISLLHAIPEAAFLLDSTGRIIAANEITALRLGVNGSELVGLDPFRHLSPGVTECRQQYVRRVFETGQPQTFKDYQGSRCKFTSIYPVTDNTGSVAKVVVCGTDITDFETAYALLTDREERLRLMYENSFDAILLTRANGAILAANPAACDFFQMTEAEICAIGRSGLLDPEDSALAPALAERAANGRARARLTFIDKSGTKKSAMVSSAQFRDSAGNLKAFVMIHAINRE